MQINRLLELHDLARQECRKYDRKRFLFPQLMVDKGRHFAGIVGARGTGKTILLRQYALEEPEPFDFLESILEKIITRDIPKANMLTINHQALSLYSVRNEGLTPHFTPWI